MQSTPNVKLLLGRNRHDGQIIIILAKIANLTLFYYVIFMNFHGITFERIKLEGWNLLQSVHNAKLLLGMGRNRHDCQIIILACIIVVLTLFNIVIVFRMEKSLPLVFNCQFDC